MQIAFQYHVDFFVVAEFAEGGNHKFVFGNSDSGTRLFTCDAFIVCVFVNVVRYDDILTVGMTLFELFLAVYAHMYY